MPRVVPKCLAVVLCEAVNRAEHTSEPSIVRAFDVIEVPAFPARTPPFTIWTQVMDGNGWTMMKLSIEHLPAGTLEPEIVLPIEFNLNFRSPNSVLEHVANLADGIELERMGRYRLVLTADDVAIAHRDSPVLQAP